MYVIGLRKKRMGSKSGEEVKSYDFDSSDAKHYYSIGPLVNEV